MFLQTFEESKKLQSFFSILSTNVAENGTQFVSTIEGEKIKVYNVYCLNKQTLWWHWSLFPAREEISLLRSAVAPWGESFPVEQKDEHSSLPTRRSAVHPVVWVPHQPR